MLLRGGGGNRGLKLDTLEGGHLRLERQTYIPISVSVRVALCCTTYLRMYAGLIKSRSGNLDCKSNISPKNFLINAKIIPQVLKVLLARDMGANRFISRVILLLKYKVSLFPSFLHAFLDT